MNLFIKYDFWIIISTVVVITSGCGTGPDTFSAGQWQQAGLPESEVNTFQTNETTLFVGTSEGAFKQPIFEKKSEWISIGLDTDSSKVIDFAILGDQIIGVIEFHDVKTDSPILFQSYNEGTSWLSIDNINKPEELNYFYIKHLEQRNNQELFAYSGYILKSTVQGETWEIIYGDGGFSEFLVIDKYHPNNIWTGGATSIYSPYLAKSEDGGDTWTLLNQQIYSGSDGTVHDAILHPENADNILIAMAGIQRSTDGGQNWQPVFEGAFISTFTHSARNPEVVYASGENADGTLFFAASQDFGDSWEMIEWKDGPAGLEVNDMVTVIVDGREVLYLGTNNGVFTYRFKE